MPSVVAFIIDASCVIAFVALGRGSHEEGGAIAGTLSVAAPFVIALALGWVVALRTRARHHPTSHRFGLTIWPITLVVGMLLRHFAFDRGTAFSFMIVATLFLALFLLGWRAIERQISRRTHPGADASEARSSEIDGSDHSMRGSTST